MNSNGMFLPTYEFYPEDYERLRLKNKEVYQNISLAVNNREIAQYATMEIQTGQQFFSVSADPTDFRQTLRKVINFGALPNAVAKAVAHGITMNANTIVTRVYAVAQDTAAVDPAIRFIPIPYVDPNVLANGVQLHVTTLNVVITTAINYTAFTQCYVVVEYINEI